MKEFLDLNQILNYALRNKEKSALGDFALGMTRHCASKHPEKLNELMNQLEVLTDTSILKSKKNYDGVSKTANTIIETIKPCLVQQATMRK